MLVFALVLLAAVLVSARARRTILSTSVMFLVAGFLVGRGCLGWLDVTPTSPIVGQLAEVALFSILFVEGASVSVHELITAWHLPGRALLIGMPLTIAGLALGCHFVLGEAWAPSLLVGAILSPTDPVFAAAILEHEAVPLRVRRLLGLESGLNDGLALPVVVVLLSAIGRRSAEPGALAADLGIGIVAGIVVPWIFVRLQRLPFLAAAPGYRPLAGVGIALTLLGLTRALGWNEFLAAFAGGITLASVGEDMVSDVLALGRPLAELFKLGALLLFGAMISPAMLADAGWRGLLFAALALLAVRPAAFVLALAGGGFERREWLAAAWFGPKGFATILYGILMLGAGIPHAARLFSVVTLVTVISVVAHSSTDVLVARTFCQASPETS